MSYGDGIVTLTQEETRELIRRAQGGCVESRNELVVRNLPYLIKLADSFIRNPLKSKNLDRDDYVAFGVLGLMRAIEKFNLARPETLLTYATGAIRRRMAIDGRDFRQLIYLPVWLYLNGGQTPDIKAKAAAARNIRAISNTRNTVKALQYEPDPILARINDEAERKWFWQFATTLPKRQRYVLALRAEGLSYTEIASYLEPEVTRGYVQQILDKISDKTLIAWRRHNNPLALSPQARATAERRAKWLRDKQLANARDRKKKGLQTCPTTS